MGERVHLTNWSSRSLHGPGPRLSIMAHPRAWEHGDGHVWVLRPSSADLRAVRADHGLTTAYLDRFEAQCRAADLRPGRLMRTLGDDEVRPVVSGSTLLCACSVAQANAGRCHRVVAARWLERAGWEVVLDGVVLGQPAREPGQLALWGTP